MLEASKERIDAGEPVRFEEEEPPIDPGEGYVLLAKGAKIIKGDEVRTDTGSWCPSAVNWKKGKSKNGVASRHLHYRRPVHACDVEVLTFNECPTWPAVALVVPTLADLQKLVAIIDVVALPKED